MTTEILRKVETLNTLRQTPNRYQVVSQFTRDAHTTRRVALVKYVGKNTSNVSGWLSPKELSAFLSGLLEGWATHEREVARSFPWR